MIDFRFGCYVSGVFVAIAMLAGCTGSHGQIEAIPQGVEANDIRVASGSENCPPYSGGTGILPDGDFSQAPDPPTLGNDEKKGTVFAPDWEVSKRTIDLMGTTSWGGNGFDGLCSVDLDGWQAGAITASAFPTKRGATYTVSFLLSGNDGSPPTVKTMKVSVDQQFTTYTWDTSGGNDIENGIYATETWQFKASGQVAVLTFSSLDPQEQRFRRCRRSHSGNEELTPFCGQVQFFMGEVSAMVFLESLLLTKRPGNDQPLSNA